MCMSICACYLSQLTKPRKQCFGLDIFFVIIEQVKQKQKGAERMLLPSVVGEEGGNWIVIDSGRIFSFIFQFMSFNLLFRPPAHHISL